MSKRTQSIRSMFSASPEEMLSADNKPVPERVTSGAVRSIKDTFSSVEKDYQRLREQLLTGTVAVDIDPNTIEPSPFADRFVDEDVSTDDVLRQSISEQGQKIPILVREHPSLSGRYQCAYGHRRIRVTKQLNVPVKAYVRPLTDEDLVVAQGIENSARQDLSFIERAMFALKLEDAGFQRAVVQSALSIDRAEASKLIAVAKSVPGDLIEAIGRAPKVGRPRWQMLSELAQAPTAVAQMRDIILTEEFRNEASDDRVELLLAVGKQLASKRSAYKLETVALANDGHEIAKLSRSGRQCQIRINRKENEAFADFVMGKIPELYELYKGEKER